MKINAEAHRGISKFYRESFTADPIVCDACIFHDPVKMHTKQDTGRHSAQFFKGRRKRGKPFTLCGLSDVFGRHDRNRKYYRDIGGDCDRGTGSGILVLDHGDIRDSDLLCGMLSFRQIPC